MSSSTSALGCNLQMSQYAKRCYQGIQSGHARMPKRMLHRPFNLSVDRILGAIVTLYSDVRRKWGELMEP